MNSTLALSELANKFGILPDFFDLSGQKQVTSSDTQLAMLRANGLVLDNDAMAHEALAEIQDQEKRRICPREVTVESNQPLTLEFGAGAAWYLTLDGEQQVSFSGRADAQIVLPSLTSGLHLLAVDNHGATETVSLIAAPKKLPMLEGTTNRSRIWGINLALYGLVSGRNCGLGDYADLADAASALGGVGAGFLGINPVHALGWNSGGAISPYSPTHRGFLNTRHIAPDRIAGLSNSHQADGIVASAGDAISENKSSHLIDYPGYEMLHHSVLEKLFAVFLKEADASVVDQFSTFCDQRGQALAEFSLFETLSEEHGPDWRNWPAGFKNKDAQELALVKKRLAPRIRFHSWLQWVAGEQLGHAQQCAKTSGMALGLYLDLAVGSRRGGAESWCDSDVIAKGVSLGAPPDHLSPAGQNWDLAAYAPRNLSACRYGPWRRAIAETMCHSGMLRIDHVLGLNRSFWIPDDGNPGAYIRQPFNALLGLIAIEVERANCVVIGEDLGLVPDGFRETMASRGFYGYSVLQYENTDKGKFKGYDGLRPQSLACFGTHDTPTLQGFKAGHDIDWWQKLGWIDQDEADEIRRKRNGEVKELLEAGPQFQLTPNTDDNISDSIHSSLAKSPAALVSVQLDDIFGQTDAQNLPGTIDEHPNWRRRVPVPTDKFHADRHILKVSKIMANGSRGLHCSDLQEAGNAG